MNKKLKKAIKDSYAAPPPQRKEVFLAGLPTPSVRFGEFLGGQLAYISKSFWGLSVLLLAAMLGWVYSDYFRMHTLLGLACTIPVLSLLAMGEVQKSFAHNMAELESACRFNLSEVTLMRLLIIGVFQLLGLVLLILLTRSRFAFGALRLTLYLVLPLLLNTGVTLFVINHWRVRLSLYGCTGITCLVSVLVWLLYRQQPLLTAAASGGWGLAVTVLLAVCGRELWRFKKNMEDYQWNWYLTE